MLERSVEAVKVVVRCRPTNARERDLKSKSVVVTESEKCTVSLLNSDDATAPAKVFTFDSVYGVLSNTEQIYNEMVYPLVEGVLEGYNATIFAYGQTGCGKSFTMQGVKSPNVARGIIPKAFEHVFEAISLADDAKFLVVASYLEIYNEEVRDLLGDDIRRRLDLKETVQTGVYVQGLSKHPVQSVADCERLMERGWSNRATGATLMNADSSRSHSIFTIAIETISDHNGGSIRQGKLNLVDLAGSERQSKTGATGERLKEATRINLSLMALGNVISALVDGKAKHIPYRDSKLTRLLQDSLGGNTKTLMIACISPADNNYDETLSTLRYANRAKNITNKPRINEDPKDTMLRQYQQEIEKLKSMLHSSGGNGGDITGGSTAEDKLRLDYENEMLKLREECQREQSNKLKLQKEMEALRIEYEKKIKDKDAISPDLKPEAFERLKKLQMSMVGGERVGDVELKEKRMRRKKASEKRLEMLGKALASVPDEDGAVLKVYDDIQEELRAKTEMLRKYKQKIRGMEKEISDIQSEFENERTDYLETIRRNERRIKLYEQITEKMVGGLRKECNYCNIEKIKEAAVWSDELEQWEIPEMILARTKLPPAGNQKHTNSWAPIIEKLRRETSINTGFGNWNNLSERRRIDTGDHEEDESAADMHSQKIDENDVEDLVGSYFKPRRVNQLLHKAREDATRALNLVNRSKVSHNQTHGNLNALNLSAGSLKKDLSINSNNDPLNNSWNGWSFPVRPNKLEALPTRTKINKLDFI